MKVASPPAKDFEHVQDDLVSWTGLQMSELDLAGETMPKVRVESFSVSLDGYGAGADQGMRDPLGRGGEALHGWFIPTRTFQGVYGKTEGTTGVDEDFASRGFADVGAWIMGRNMFGPVRGEWPDDRWRGWWGDNPPYHVPVFVLTHYPREPVEMEGGTTFIFVTDGIEAALDRARQAAGGEGRANRRRRFGHTPISASRPA